MYLRKGVGSSQELRKWALRVMCKLMSANGFTGKTQQDLSVPKRRKPCMKNLIPKAAGMHTEEGRLFLPDLLDLLRLRGLLSSLK